MKRGNPAAAARFLLIAALACLLAACALPPILGDKGKPGGAPATPQPSGSCVALALPMSGQFSAIADKIGRGARQAQAELAQGGEKLRLEFINTEAPDWLRTLETLPQECAVVGGPLRASLYAQARKAGALEKRAVFAFVPSLDQGDEGVRAWRFFPSPQDQVDALINFATGGMDIRSYGAFYPDDAYGRRMTSLMEQSLAARNLLLQKASYNPADSASWSAAVMPLVNPVMAADGKTPVPQTALEALFLPDSWKNMDALVGSLLYNGEDRLVLLGTTLWEQGLSGRSVPKAAQYALAVFPGAWNQAMAPQALRVPGSDFWTALGYDFARFGSAMRLKSRPSATQVTAAAQNAAKMHWGMAPLAWDAAGVAHQRLYVFGVSPAGMTPVNAADLRQVRERVREQANLRFQGLPPVDETGAAVTPPADGAEGLAPQGQPAPAAPQPAISMPSSRAVSQPASGAPIMSSTPRPSYKLSLPQAR